MTNDEIHAIYDAMMTAETFCSVAGLHPAPPLINNNNLSALLHHG